MTQLSGGIKNQTAKSKSRRGRKHETWDFTLQKLLMEDSERCLKLGVTLNTALLHQLKFKILKRGHESLFPLLPLEQISAANLSEILSSCWFRAYLSLAEPCFYYKLESAAFFQPRRNLWNFRWHSISENFLDTPTMGK